MSKTSRIRYTISLTLEKELYEKLKAKKQLNQTTQEFIIEKLNEALEEKDEVTVKCVYCGVLLKVKGSEARMAKVNIPEY